MSDFPQPRDGRVDLELARRWPNLPPSEDGPFLAVNLTRYRLHAEYADGRETELSGREADDAYTPFGPLAAVGAQLVLAAEVADQPHGAPTFHRVAIVRYPSRASFLEMQRREDFQELHVHKEAGMEFTIIVAAEPPPAVGGGATDAPLVLRLRRLVPGAGTAAGDSAVVRLVPEGAIVGDERRWDELRIDRLDPGALGTPSEAAEVEEQITIVLATPLLDALALAAEPARLQPARDGRLPRRLLAAAVDLRGRRPAPARRCNGRAGPGDPGRRAPRARGLRDAFATDALVRREPGELFALRHEVPAGRRPGGPVQAWVERLDPLTLATAASTPRCPAGATGRAASPRTRTATCTSCSALGPPALAAARGARLPPPARRAPAQLVRRARQGRAGDEGLRRPAGLAPSTVSVLDPGTLLPVAHRWRCPSRRSRASPATARA